MIADILSAIAGFIITTISTLGYGGIALLMAIESACIPLPSEIIMPFSGSLVSTGRFTLFGTALAGAFGCVLGSIAAYAAGRFGGRQFVLRYGRYLLIAPQDVALADRWFARHGQLAIFASRLLPVVRTFISLPAGITGMRFLPFVIWTFLGSLPWCYALAYAGMKLGDNWAGLEPYFRKFDVLIGIILLAGVISWVHRHLKALKEHAAQHPAPRNRGNSAVTL